MVAEVEGHRLDNKTVSMFYYQISRRDHVQAGDEAHHAHVTFMAPRTAACSSTVVVTTAGGRGHWMRMVVAVVHWIDVCRDPTRTIKHSDN